MGTGFVDIGPEDTEPVDIDLKLTQLASVHHSSLNRYQLFSHAAANMLCSVSHHGLLIDIPYSINWQMHLPFSLSINILLTNSL